MKKKGTSIRINAPSLPIKSLLVFSLVNLGIILAVIVGIWVTGSLWALLGLIFLASLKHSDVPDVDCTVTTKDGRQHTFKGTDWRFEEFLETIGDSV